jgi:hypothetical protein
VRATATLSISIFMILLLGFVSTRDGVEESMSSPSLIGDSYFRALIPSQQSSISGMSNCRHSCTIVYASDDKVALAGNNEDYKGRLARIHFLPAEGRKFGRVYFGFDVAKFPQGGMNEKGLFFDAATFDRVIVVPRDPSKPVIEGQLILKAMEECSTVDEVLRLFEQYDFSGRMGGHYLVGDRFGNSVIIEPRTVIRKQGRYQIATNFAQSEIGSGGIADHRYRIASELFENSKELSVDVIRRILSATHFEESGTTTLYSYICDLKNGDVYIYNFHNFEDVVKINLQEKLKKGEHICTISSLFPYETFAQKRYREETGFKDD